MENVKGFAYRKCIYRFVARFKDGKWQKGRLTKSANILLNESACVLQYAQTVFEGLKAYRTKDGQIVCFRPDLNEARLHDSCERMMIPPLPEGMFLDALKKVVKANADAVPSYESGGALYLRPFIFGSNATLGVKPATEYEFRLFASPVGSYFSGGIKPLNLQISDFDRAAPCGTGHIKAGLNYAMSLYAICNAHEHGFDENVYLDAKTRTYLEETGGANILLVNKAGDLLTPKSDTILPSITRRSILELAKDRLGMNVREEKIPVTDLSEMAEAALCGTAAVISPVGSIRYGERTYTFDTARPGGKLLQILDLLFAIQHKEIPAPENWIFEIS